MVTDIHLVIAKVAKTDQTTRPLLPCVCLSKSVAYTLFLLAAMLFIWFLYLSKIKTTFNNRYCLLSMFHFWCEPYGILLNKKTLDQNKGYKRQLQENPKKKNKKKTKKKHKQMNSSTGKKQIKICINWSIKLFSSLERDTFRLF